MCHICKRQFKREDYLRRHQLSHGEAKFQCNHPDCGLIFHRKDVLIRHQKVHVLDSNIKRRRPRRGANPNPFVTPAPDLQSPGELIDDEPITQAQKRSKQPDVEYGVANPTYAILDDVSFTDLEFCSLHFRVSCQRRNPVMHHTSLARQNMQPSKFLAMAVMGANAIPRFQVAKKEFFQKAKAALMVAYRHNIWTQADAATNDESLEALNQDLELVQATALLLEYAFWSEDLSDRLWAKEQVSQLVCAFIPDMVLYVHSIGETSCKWSVWIHREQSIRLIWSICNMLTKVKNFLRIPITVPRFEKGLPFPSSDAAFDAHDEAVWLKELKASRMVTDFSTATFLLTSAEANIQLLPHQVSCIGRHVLLVSLLDYFHLALASPFNFDSLEAYRRQSLVGFKCRQEFHRAIENWKRLWWNDPAELFYTEPQQLADFQNAFFSNYLEILVLAGSNDDSVSKSEFLSAMRIVCSIFYTVSRDGAFEISTIVSFLMDAETRFYVTTFARLMISWADRVKHHELADNLEEGDYDIFTRCCESLKTLSKDLHQPVLNSDLSNLSNLKKALFEVWSTVLDRKDWAKDI